MMDPENAKPLKIGIWGAGKMGLAIRNEAASQNIDIVWMIGKAEAAAISDASLRQADVVIEITAPEAAFDNVLRCIQAGIPVVTGTTGWYANLPEMESQVAKHRGALLYASNFSPGVNLFLMINEAVAAIMSGQHGYHLSMREVHHVHKKDAPSGTAITLAERIQAASKGRWSRWIKGSEATKDNTIPIESVREEEVPGTHEIILRGTNDAIVLSHTAYNRADFAAGAIIAAQWLIGKSGVFTMNDVLKTSLE